MPDDKHNRRQFFREGFARIADSLAGAISRSEDILSAAQTEPECLTRHSAPTRPLRPPGAVPEFIFARTCDHSGECVTACPANAIALTVPSPDSDELTPCIDANLSACVVCDGLLCTHACPSGALRPLTEPSQISMGLAIVHTSLCVRSNDENCTVCVDVCPIGESAIRFEGPGPPIISQSNCVGCGVCQQHCPTTPKAIVIEPK